VGIDPANEIAAIQYKGNHISQDNLNIQNKIICAMSIKRKHEDEFQAKGPKDSLSYLINHPLFPNTGMDIAHRFRSGV
jgi:hypothetical protein